MNFNRISTYTEKELGNFTNNEIKSLVQHELTFDGDNEAPKQVIVDIEQGTYVNPFKTEKTNIFKTNILTPALLAVGGWVVFVNLIPGVPNIPLLSDITPVISHAEYLNGESDFRIVSHRELNRGFILR